MFGLFQGLLVCLVYHRGRVKVTTIMDDMFELSFRMQKNAQKMCYVMRTS